MNNVVNGDTTLTIGKYNSANESSFTPLNIYKVTNFYKACNSSDGFYGNLYPTNGGGSITGINGNTMIYTADSAAGGVHLIKANNEDVLRLYSTGILAYKQLTVNAKIITNGINCNSPASSFYVGGGNHLC